MALPKSGITIHRQSVAGEENEWVKMFDPPTESPPTPELLTPTNPVPEFMAANGYASAPVAPNTVSRNLMHGMPITMWDGKDVTFFLFQDPKLLGKDANGDNFSDGQFPGPTTRVPRGKIFHSQTSAGGPPPHTIHWHGIEPTPMNDGVGHCSMEVGQYTYQWQPNFIGSYFYHCHRNTMQHFEFGLYGFLIIEPPDAFDGPNAGGYPRRTAANLAAFPQFPGFNSKALDTLDPHAMTVPYDVEALWVFDDRDSVWSDNMPDPRATFPRHGDQPGVNDQFLKGDFHDFNPDYFFVTGVNFPAPAGGTGTIPAGIVVPPQLNSGVTGMQVPISASVGQTILVRTLNAAYVGIRVSFPVDVVVIAFDGRALGVPPLAQYNHAFNLPAGTPYELSTARRFDALIRSDVPVHGFGKVEYFDVRGGALLFTGKIPIDIE
jgi:FtsP/CotA-like multicopper oxidase with cupredoxin domain